MTIKELSDKFIKLSKLNCDLESIEREIEVCNQFREELLRKEYSELKKIIEGIENENI